MKRVGFFVGALSLVLVLVGMGFSQGEGKKEEKKAKGFLPAGWKKLRLAADQTDKIYKIQTAWKAKIQKLEAEVKELRATEHKELLGILTDDQKKKLIGEGAPAKKDDVKKDADKK